MKNTSQPNTLDPSTTTALTCSLHRFHQVDRTIPKFRREILDLTHADSVFSCTCTVESDRPFYHIMNGMLDNGEFFIVVEQGERVYVTVSDMATRVMQSQSPLSQSTSKPVGRIERQTYPK